MAEVNITQEQWDSALALFKKVGNSPMRVAKKLGISLSLAKQLHDTGIPDKFPPIAPILRAHLDEKFAERVARHAAESKDLSGDPVENRHVGQVLIPVIVGQTNDTTTNSGTQTPTHKTAEPEPAPTPKPVTPPSTSLPPPVPPETTSNEAGSLQINDTAAALAQALDTVQRDLAAALLRENTLVKGLREQAIGLASGGVDAVRAYTVLIRKITQKIIQSAERGEIEERRAFTLIPKLMKVSAVASQQAERVMELERLLVGLPQSISTTVEPGKGGGDRIGDLEALTRSLEALASAQRDRSAIDVSATAYRGEESGGD